MSDTTKTPQHGADTASSGSSGQKPGAQQQAQQPSPAPQQQSGGTVRGPIFKDWASI